MAFLPKIALLRRSLAVCALAASVIIAQPQPAAAADAAPDQAASPWALYFQGKGGMARAALVQRLKDPAAQNPAARLSTLETLLDICIHSYAKACILENVPKYIEAAKAAPYANEIQRREQVRKLGYYVDYGRYVFGSEEITGRILDGDLWSQENAANEALYIRRQILASDIQLTLGDYAGATRSVDKILSLIAAVKNPQEDRHLIAWALSDAIGALVVVGDIERAYGVYKSSGSFIADHLPPLSVDAAAYRLVEAQVLQGHGDIQGSLGAAATAASLIRRIDLEDDVRAAMLSEAMTLVAVNCAAQLQMTCAREAMNLHPFARLYTQSGRLPATYEEVAYLAARALVAAFEGGSDPIAAEALAGEMGFSTDQRTTALVDVYRAAGTALGRPPGPARQDGMAETGRRIVAAMDRKPAGTFGGWYRPGAIDHLLIGLALTQTGREGRDAAETDFTLLQLAMRRGASVDADALTALGQAKDALQRRSIHQALRLRARRDRFERAELQKTVQRAGSATLSEGQLSTGALMSADYDTRRVFRDFAVRLAAADRELETAGVATSGANIVKLAAFQDTLGPNEAALAVVPVPGGMAYMCLRRETTLRRVATANLQQMQFDIRIIQAALTAGHAPSESLDVQFPVGAAMRLYDVLIRPFDGCLKSGDHILWLPNASITPLPLAILLEQAPPKFGEGYDLAAADWLVRRHAVSYAGSAAMVLAARSGAARTQADFDFLGVGDPVLSGATPAGEDRGDILLRGVRGAAGLSSLAPLPETRIELEQSAKGFQSTRLLVGGEATERKVRSQMIGAYRYLSFATHGLIRDDLQGLTEPALALTPVSASDSADDGLLTASEIADLSLAARFVALSACNTANFDLTQMAADLPALASAFAVAGAPSILGTLWPVESEAGQRVVAGAFARLNADPGDGPALALAAAQRDFLAAPPGRAYLHPRFWAPFLVLGDGAAVADPAIPAKRVAATEVLTQGGDVSEVIGVARSRGQVLSRFIGAPDPEDRRAAGVRLSDPHGAEVWRHETQEIGANRLIIPLGDTVIAGGYALGPHDHFVPTLEAFDRASGAPAGVWRGETSPGLDGFIAGGARLGPSSALFAVAQVNLRGEAKAPRLLVFEVGAALAPRFLFDIKLPSGASLDEVTLTPLGADLLVTYTDVNQPSDGGRMIEDDFDTGLCLPVPQTSVELRILKTGEMKASTRLAGWMVAAALERDGEVLLGGAVRDDCRAELRAAALSLSADVLEARPLYQDESLGDSEIRSLVALPKGAVLAAGRKQNVLDYRPRGDGALGRRLRPADRGLSYSGMVLTLQQDGRATASKMLDAGSDVFLMSADASDPDQILLGGSIGGEAAIFHLTESRPAKKRRSR